MQPVLPMAYIIYINVDPGCASHSGQGFSSVFNCPPTCPKVYAPLIMREIYRSFGNWINAKIKTHNYLKCVSHSIADYRPHWHELEHQVMSANSMTK